MSERDWTPEPWFMGERPIIAPPITAFERSEVTGEWLVTLLWSDYERAARCVNACAHLTDAELAGGVVSAGLAEEAFEYIRDAISYVESLHTSEDPPIDKGDFIHTLENKLEAALAAARKGADR